MIPQATQQSDCTISVSKKTNDKISPLRSTRSINRAHLLNCLCFNKFRNVLVLYWNILNYVGSLNRSHKRSHKGASTISSIVSITLHL